MANFWFRHIKLIKWRPWTTFLCSRFYDNGRIQLSELDRISIFYHCKQKVYLFWSFWQLGVTIKQIILFAFLHFAGSKSSQTVGYLSLYVLFQCMYSWQYYNHWESVSFQLFFVEFCGPNTTQRHIIIWNNSVLFNPRNSINGISSV